MTTPETESGRQLLEWLFLNGGAFPTSDRDHIENAIAAIEREAKQLGVHRYGEQLNREGRVIVHLSTLERGRRG